MIGVQNFDFNADKVWFFFMWSSGLGIKENPYFSSLLWICAAKILFLCGCFDYEDG